MDTCVEYLYALLFLFDYVFTYHHIYHGLLHNICCRCKLMDVLFCQNWKDSIQIYENFVAVRIISHMQILIEQLDCVSKINITK